jgi:hypothetical protein
MLEKVYGAYACIWFDQKLEKLYLLRNKERTLTIAKTSIGYVFASEFAMIAAACIRHGLKIDSSESVEEHVLYSIDLSKYDGALTKESVPVKKSSPAPLVNGTKSGPGVTNRTISKREFNKIRNERLGTYLCFEPKDYVEAKYPIINGDYMLLGISESLKFNHTVKGFIYNKSPEVLDMCYQDTLVSGKIADVEYDKGRVIITVEDIMPFVEETVH